MWEISIHEIKIVPIRFVLGTFEWATYRKSVWRLKVEFDLIHTHLDFGIVFNRVIDIKYILSSW